MLLQYLLRKTSFDNLFSLTIFSKKFKTNKLCLLLRLVSFASKFQKNLKPINCVSFLGWYHLLASKEQQSCTRDIIHSLPTVLQGGVRRFGRSASAGLMIGLDYKYSLWGMEETSEEYQDTMSQVHSRSAEKILDTCLENGGLYIKFGQAVSIDLSNKSSSYSSFS